MIQQQARIRFSTQIAPDCFHLGISCGGELLTAVPGQFVMVQVGDTSLNIDLVEDSDFIRILKQ